MINDSYPWKVQLVADAEIVRRWASSRLRKKRDLW